MGNPNLIAAFALGLLFGAPWLAASVLVWRKLPRDGHVPPSAATLWRTRYSVS